MKKLLLSIFTILCLTDAIAQASGGAFYVRAGGGYAFALAGQTMDNVGIPYSGSMTYLSNNYAVLTDFDSKKISFASGAQAVVSLEYMLSKYVGLEVDFNAVPSNVQNVTYLYNTLNPTGADYADEKYTRQVNFPFFITPSLVFSTGDDKKIAFYGRGGLVLPVSTKMTADQFYLNPVTGEIEDVKSETKFKSGAGFSGSMGVKFNVSPLFGVWVEANMQTLSLYADHTTITDHTLNGDPAPAIRPPVAGNVINYSTTGSYTPTSQPTYSVPFSNIGMNIGICLKIATLKQQKEKNK